MVHDVCRAPVTVRLLKNQDDVGAAIQPKGAEFTMRPYNIRPDIRVAFREGVSIELIERSSA
jgi:hypothetical protein